SFNKGDHGSLLGNTSYYVNPKANKKLNDLAPLPKIIPDTDYIFDKYSPIFNGDTIINKDMSFTATYLYNKKVIEITPNNPNKPNDNYVRISFNATNMGHFEDNTTLKSYYVLKNITFKEAKDNGLLIPKAYYNDDTKSFDSYSPSLLNDNDSVFDCDYIATYTDNIKKVEPKDPSKPFNPEDTNDSNTPDITKGYKRLIFKSGIGGLLNGKDEVLVYDVKEDLTWAYINTKKLIPNIVSFKYFIFTNWDKNFPSDNTVLKDLSDNIFTALYQELPKSSKPSVDPIADTDKIITGKGSPLSEIEITFEDNTTITTKTDDKGNYQVKLDKPLKKDTKVIIIQKEDHKKPSDPTLTTVIHKNIKTLPNTGSNTTTTTNIMAYMMMIITTILLSLLLSFTNKQTSFKNK
ncbi:MAG: Ig-like domain-containing protein, partial [Erysipelotrichaceae bacterium]|nr:Ig-like domain-containing protein [Erysipelotrichaceae bacterium]